MLALWLFILTFSELLEVGTKLISSCGYMCLSAGKGSWYNWWWDSCKSLWTWQRVKSFRLLRSPPQLVLLLFLLYVIWASWCVSGNRSSVVWLLPLKNNKKLVQTCVDFTNFSHVWTGIQSLDKNPVWHIYSSVGHLIELLHEAYGIGIQCVFVNLFDLPCLDKSH